MKKVLIAALTCAMVVSLTSCDKIKEALSRDITVNNVKFDFPIQVVGEDMRATRDGTMNPFSVTREVDISEISSSEVMEYASKISKVTTNSSLLSVTAVPAGSYSVANVKISTVGIPGEIIVPAYTMGSSFTAPANMNDYTSALIMKLLTAKKLTVTISGETDAPVPTTLNISYESDLVFTVGLLE